MPVSEYRQMIMRQAFGLRLTILAIFIAGFADIAIAEPCNETTFRRVNYRLYNDAYEAFVEQEDFDAATDKLARLTRRRGLNCYEQGTALLLGAEIKRIQGDLAGTIADLESYIDQELGNEQLILSTRQTIYRIYTNQGDYQAAADSAEQWITEGAQPIGVDALYLATLFFETDRIDSAITTARRQLETASGTSKAVFYRYLFDLYNISSDAEGLTSTLDQFEAFLNTEQMSDQERSNSWGLLVSAYSDIDQQDTALRVMNMRVDRGDTLLPVDWVTLAYLSYRTGNFADAVEWGEQLRAADGEHADITLNALLHLSYGSLGDVAASAEFGEKLDTDQLAEDIIKLEWDPTDTEAAPIAPPRVTYPPAALARGKEGKCSVFFDVDSTGVPFNVNAECTDNVFKSESIRSVSQTRFSPKTAGGLPRNRRNVVYPIVFNLSN